MFDEFKRKKRENVSSASFGKNMVERVGLLSEDGEMFFEALVEVVVVVVGGGGDVVVMLL